MKPGLAACCLAEPEWIYRSATAQSWAGMLRLPIISLSFRVAMMDTQGLGLSRSSAVPCTAEDTNPDNPSREPCTNAEQQKGRVTEENTHSKQS